MRSYYKLPIGVENFERSLKLRLCKILIGSGPTVHCRESRLGISHPTKNPDPGDKNPKIKPDPRNFVVCGILHSEFFGIFLGFFRDFQTKISVPGFFGIFLGFFRDFQVQIPIPGFCVIFWGFDISIPIPGISGFFDLAQNKKSPGSGFTIPKNPIPKPNLVLKP